MQFALGGPDHDDFARICDRVLIFRYGSVVDELVGGSLAEERIVERCDETSAAAHGVRR
jgi:ABC-type sugar transport system ATPase subunit